MKASFFLTASLLVITLFLAGCSGGSGSANDQYFSGYDGVAMRFLPGTPTTVYYYSSPIDKSVDNTFSFNVEVADKGSADTYGGLYISGYDPGFIAVEGVDVARKGSGFNCDFDSLIFQGKFLAAATCKVWDSTVSAATNGNGEITDIAATIKGKTLVELFGADKNSKLEKILQGIVIEGNYDPMTGKGGFGVDYADQKFNMGASSNGDLAIAYLNAMSYRLIQRRFIDPSHGKEFTLIGDRQTYPGGEQDIINFNAGIKNWPRGLMQVPQTFLITSCYGYTTYADPQVCVDPFPESSDRKVCKPKKITYPRGQGAPVAVTSVEQTNTPRSIIFTVNIANKGKGQVYAPGSLVKCDPLNADRVTPKDLNMVYIGDIHLAGNDQLFRCQPDNRYVRLDDKGQGSFTCEFPIEYSVKSAYQSPLIIGLWYGYSETIQKTVNLKRAN